MSAQTEVRTLYVHRTYGNRLSLPEADDTSLLDQISGERLMSNENPFTRSAIARAYDLIVGLRIFRIDAQGAGKARGVQAFSPTLGSPERMVTLRDEMSAMWLQRHFDAKGVRVRMLWVN